MVAKLCICLILSLLGGASTSTFPSRLLEDSVHFDDGKKLQNFFEKHLQEVDDPSKIHNALIGINSVGLSPGNPEKICKTLTKKAATKNEMFHRVCAATLLGISCKVLPDETLLKNPDFAEISADDLFEDVMIRKCAGLHVDSPQILKLLDKIAAGDKSPNSIALILQIATQLDLKNVDANRFVSSISTVLQQADGLEGMLFYEKGLYTTSMVAIGVFDFIDKYGSVTDVPEAQLTKLLNFILTRRYSNNLRAAAYLRKAIQLAMRNRILMPVVFEVATSEDVVRLAMGGELPKTNPLLQVKLVTLSGQPVADESVSLTAHGLHAVPDGTLVGPSERGRFVYDKVKSTFQLPLAVSNTEYPPRGYYWIELDASLKVANETRVLLGGTNVRLPMRIVTNASVVSTKMTIFDAAHERHVSDITLKPAGTPSVSPIGLDLDHQVRLAVHLAETATGGSAAADRVPLLAHQVFVQLTHQGTGQAITFVCSKATTDSQTAAVSQAYELLLDPKKSAADFDNLAGVYKMELIVGDSLISRPLVWHMADLRLNFIGQSGDESQRRATSAQDVSRRQLASVAASKAARSLVGTGPEQMKPSIEHIFRPSEKRVSSLLARLFTLACLVPFLGLLVAWAVIGLNLGNFVFSLSGLVFHAGLIAIFCLYYAYWCYLDMFTTLGYLTMLGVPTFLAGNSLLRNQLALRSASPPKK